MRSRSQKGSHDLQREVECYEGINTHMNQYDRQFMEVITYLKRIFEPLLLDDDLLEDAQNDDIMIECVRCRFCG